MATQMTCVLLYVISFSDGTHASLDLARGSLDECMAKKPLARLVPQYDGPKDVTERRTLIVPIDDYYKQLGAHSKGASAAVH